MYGGNLRKKCENYNKGNCQEGRQCLFSHSFIPDIAKVKLNKLGRKFVFPTLKGSATRGLTVFTPTIKNGTLAETSFSRRNA